MKKQTIVVIGNLLIGISAAASLALVVMLKPTSYKVLIMFEVWTLFPYFLFFYPPNFLSKNFRQAVKNVAISCLCSLGGMLWALNLIKINPDPQGGLGVLMIPAIQILGFLFLHFIASQEEL